MRGRRLAARINVVCEVIESARAAEPQTPFRALEPHRRRNSISLLWHQCFVRKLACVVGAVRLSVLALLRVHDTKEQKDGRDRITSGDVTNVLLS